MESSPIRCQVCCRSSGPNLSFYCPACVQASVDEPRLQNAAALLSKEGDQKAIEHVLEAVRVGRHHSQPSSNHDVATQSALLQQIQSAALSSTQQTVWVEARCSEVKLELAEMKSELQRAKLRLTERRANHDAAQKNLTRQEALVMKPLCESIRQLEGKWNAVADRTADVKVFLCKELGSLCGLTHKRRRKVNGAHDQYMLGQVPILDLRDLNSSSPVLITVSLGRVAHFVHLAAHYLSIRLPAEIVLPSAANAYPHIFPPSQSYKESFLHLPPKTKGVPADPTAKDPPTRPRVLLLEKPLSLLASQDSISYSLFVDAVTYLAWDIAWLARTQGHDVTGERWEDICAMGKSLSTMFGPRAVSKSNTIPSATVTSSNARTPVQNPPRASTSSRPQLAEAHIEPNLDEGPPITSGHLSHASARAYLPASAQIGGGAEHMRSWPFANPRFVIEKIKNALLNERMAAEWELLEEDEWNEGVEVTPQEQP